MNFRRIFCGLILAVFLTGMYAAEPNQFSSVPDSGGWQSTVAGAGEECYHVNYLVDTQSMSPDTLLTYEFSDHILVHSGLEKSRCVILKDVPYAGYFRVKVVAMYTKGVDAEQSQEEYRLCIAVKDDVYEGGIVPDQNHMPQPTGDVYKPDKPKLGYDYYQNDHGFKYLQKGDNKVFFRTGNQYTGGGKNNSVDFHSISLIPQKPTMVEEPKFTAGTSNTVSYRTVFEDIYAQDVVFFDQTAASSGNPAAQLRKALPDSFRSVTFNGLLDGHTYGYYVETYLTPSQFIHSDITFSTQDATPPEMVIINPMSSFANRRAELYWHGVDDEVSGVDYYEIIRYESTDGATTVVVGRMPALAGRDTTNFYHFTDLISDGSNLNNVYQYRIDTYDKVGNRSTGAVTQLVVGIPAPNLQVIGRPMFERYHQGALVTVSASIADLELPSSHLIKFQIARDNPKFLDDEWKPNVYFFQSDWLPVQETGNPAFTFDLSDSGKLDKSFADGHRYYIRAQFKDLQNNYSAWSSPDTLWVTPDCFAPEDIPWLQVVAEVDTSNTVGNMKVTWGEAKDLTSGLQSYLIYRRVVGIDDFTLIGATPQTFFIDSFDSIGYNREVEYRVLSVDRVANQRQDSKHQVTLRCQEAPKQQLSYEVQSGGMNYTSRYLEVLVVDLSRFKFDSTIAKIVVKRTFNGKEEEFDWPEKPSASLNSISVSLQTNGVYTFRTKVLFTTKEQSLWSTAETITKMDDLNDVPGTKTVTTDLFAVQNHPNPFNPTTQISFRLDEDAHIVVEVFNVQGRRIKLLRDGFEKRGVVSVMWNGTTDEEQPVASGMYFYALRVKSDRGPEITTVKNMLLLK